MQCCFYMFILFSETGCFWMKKRIVLGSACSHFCMLYVFKKYIPYLTHLSVTRCHIVDRLRSFLAKTYGRCACILTTHMCLFCSSASQEHSASKLHVHYISHERIQYMHSIISIRFLAGRIKETRAKAVQKTTN